MKMLRSGIKRLVPVGTLKWLRRWRLHHTHVVVANGDRAFCAIGNPESVDHFTRIYLGGPPHVRVRNGFNRADFSALALRMARRHGLVVVSGVPLPARLAPTALRVPRFVALSVDIGESEPAFLATLSRNARDDLRRIRSNGYRVERHRDADWAGEFVDKYHKASITLRHGSEGFVATARDIAKAVRDDGWEFLCVMKGEQCVAALVGEPHPSGYRMRQMGWLHGDPALVKGGVLPALYWFAMQRARELGLRRLRMAGTPPYLEDGLFKYKMKWNAEFDLEDTRYGLRHLIIDTRHRNVRGLFAGRSIVGLDASDRFVVYSCKPPAEVPLPDHLRRGIGHWYRLADGAWVTEDAVLGTGDAASIGGAPPSGS